MNLTELILSLFLFNGEIFHLLTYLSLSCPTNWSLTLAVTIGSLAIFGSWTNDL
jgi:hypothetical protein